MVFVVKEVAQPNGVMEPSVDVNVLPEQLGEKGGPLVREAETLCEIMLIQVRGNEGDDFWREGDE